MIGARPTSGSRSEKEAKKQPLVIDAWYLQASSPGGDEDLWMASIKTLMSSVARPGTNQNCAFSRSTNGGGVFEYT